MSEILEDSKCKWELVNRLINKNWSNKDTNCFFSFNTDRKKEFSKKEIKKLLKVDGQEYSYFSYLVNQMPRNKVFDVSDKLLWKEYQKIFFCATIDKQYDNNLFKEQLNINKQWLDKYTKFEEEYGSIEEEYISAINSKKPEEIIAILTRKLSDKKKDWVLNGYKAFIEEKRNLLYAEGEFSYAYQWSKWKSLAENAWFVGHEGVDSKYGSFTANFRNILEENWIEESFSHKDLGAVTSGFQVEEDDIGIKNLVKEVDKLTFKYMKVIINRHWFETDVFTSKFWKWKSSYNGRWLSEGNLKGSLPSYIEEVIFIKEIQFRERSNVVFDLLEWVGGGFGELDFIPFLENEKGGVFLAVYSCKKVPKCPFPNFN